MINYSGVLYNTANNGDWGTFDDDVPPTSSLNQLVFDNKTLDNLWNQMYIKAKKVILMCRWCGAGNAITNDCCVKCGGPSPTEGMN